MSPIQTRTSSLSITLSAIAVCWWALAVDFACGLRAVTAELWGGYLQDRRERRQFDITHPVLAEPQAQSALDTVAQEIGQPACLWLVVMACVLAVALISAVDGWPLLAAAVIYLRG